jgi:hypothetical protein
MERLEKQINKESFTEEDAERLVKATLGEDIFEKPDQEIQKPKSLGAAAAKKEEKTYKPYISGEIDRLGQALVEVKAKIREARTTKEKDYYEGRAIFFREELEKAKAVRDKIKGEKGLDKDQLAA